MDSTSARRALRGLAAVLLALGALPALARNHELVVPPVAAGRFAVACTNVEQDAARIAPGASATDYWEGRPTNDQAHYVTDLLVHPDAAIVYPVAVPDQRSLYPGHAGDSVDFAAIVCYPTSQGNTDPDYVLPQTHGTIPHMQRPGEAPVLVSAAEYAATLGLVPPGTVGFPEPPPSAPQPLPLIVFSHGLGGSPVSPGYVDVLVQLAAQGYMVAAPFHGDSRFSRIRVEDLSDAYYLLDQFDRVVEMQLMRPLSLSALLDRLLADPAFAAGVDAQRIGGFGASLGGEAMALLLGAKLTTGIGLACSDAPHDARIRAAVGYVPYAGQSFLPAFCGGQSGAEGVDRPYLAISGTADTTAPIGLAAQAVNRFRGSRYLVQLVGGRHELRPEDAGDVFTWTITFLDAYLQVPADPGAMARFIRMNGVTGGRDDSLVVDVHVPFPPEAGDTPVVEFHNTVLDHYFMAAGAGEIAGIDAGAAGPGWERTGESFKAWLAMPADPSVLAAPVCRFYGVPAGGPNSHFFTSDPAECDLVKRQGGWYYEGIGFYIRPAPADGRCPDGYLGVMRAYNMGFPRNDSNHRYSTSDSTMRDMARLGWVVEGTAMCALP